MSKSNNTIAKRYQNATTFYEHLKLALEYQSAPEILREYSPLAKPYFLNQPRIGDSMGARSIAPADAAATVDWGEVLSQKLYEAAGTLWRGQPPSTAQALLDAVADEAAQRGRGSHYDYLILELNYFKRLFEPAPKTQAEIYNDILHISRTSHDRYLKEAVERLGTLLLQRLRPPLRLEMPTLRAPLFGRVDAQAQALNRLQQGGSVTITGAGGMGKSSLGAALVDAWPSPAVHWYTLRPGLNDTINSLLFSLGYFLYQQGASALWLQLIADEGKMEDINLALGLVRSDIETLPHRPLLCFDESDLLRASDIDRPNPHHSQLLHFLESLRPHSALLLIGQRAVLESDITLALDRLHRHDIEAWLRAREITATAQEITDLEAYTGGNPRLLTLCMTLHQLEGDAQAENAVAGQGEQQLPQSLSSTLVRLPHTAALAPIWDRLRTRLSAYDRQILQALAVFRTPAPKDAWQHYSEQAATAEGEIDLSASIARLLMRQLIQGDEQGGIWLLPILRETLYDDMTVETRESYHLVAAQIYAARGEYTEAAYHFHHGGRPDRAIESWFPERRSEIQRGQAGAALTIVEEISAHRLKRPQQKQLALVRAELYGLLGEPAKVVDSLAALEWHQDEPESVEALRLWGEALNVQGDALGAQEKLQEGVYVVTHLLEQYAHLHVQRGLIHMQQREMKAAWQEATRARYYAENLQGAIQANLGNFDNARDHYQVALDLSEEMNDIQSAARTQNYLGIAAMQQQRLDVAFAHYQAAIAGYQQAGNRAQEVYVRSNLAVAYLTGGDYHAAIEEAKAALTFCERMNSPYWMATNAVNLAEAHFELGELEQAETYAMQVIQHEEVDSYPYALFTLGSVRRQQQRFADAHHFYTQSCHIAEQNEDRFLLAYAHRGLGGVYADQGEVSAAQEAFQQALTFFRQLGIDAEANATEEALKNLSAAQ